MQLNLKAPIRSWAVFTPWKEKPVAETLWIDVVYDHTKLSKNDISNAAVSIGNQLPKYEMDDSGPKNQKINTHTSMANSMSQMVKFKTVFSLSKSFHQ
jgi:hypothetical protein